MNPTGISFRNATEAYPAAKPDDPVSLRIEASLLAAIPGMPRLEKPDPSRPRLFNLRVYESHNERAAAKKVEMLETAELAIFRRVGLTPVYRVRVGRKTVRLWLGTAGLVRRRPRPVNRRPAVSSCPRTGSDRSTSSSPRPARASP
jgi:hypothetical protein